MHLSDSHNLHFRNSWPEILQAEITTKCNLVCTFCKNNSVEVQSRGSMSLDLYKSILEQGKDRWKRVNLWGTGEPLMNKDFFEMASFAKMMKIERIKVSTNGHFFTDVNVNLLLECGITEVRVAIDSINPSTYKKLRVNGSLEQVIRGVKRLVKSRNKTGIAMKIIICSVVSNFNYKEVESIEKFSKNVGADEHEKISNIWREQFDKIGLSPANSRCNQQLKTFNVLANGNIVPCCHTYMGEVTLGNVKNDSVENIWNGDKALSTRKDFLENCFFYCQNCNYGLDLNSRE